MPIPFKTLLLVEDNPLDASFIKDCLKPPISGVPWVFKVVEADTLADGLDKAGSCDVLLLDLTLPDSNGLETLRMFHNLDIPIIVVTAVDDVQMGITAVKEGAQDFLTKGKFTSESLQKSILYAMERYLRLAAEMHLRNLNDTLSGFKDDICKLTSSVREANKAMSKLIDGSNLEGCRNATAEEQPNRPAIQPSS